MGDRIGWVAGDDLFLDPSAAYKVAQAQAQASDGVLVGERTLRKRLHERGHLVTTEAERKTLTIRATFEERRHNVLHLRADFIKGSDEPESLDPSIPI